MMMQAAAPPAAHATGSTGAQQQRRCAAAAAASSSRCPGGSSSSCIRRTPGRHMLLAAPAALPGRLRGRPGSAVVAAGAAAGASPATTAAGPTEWLTKTVTLPQHKRGCHVITRKLLAQLDEIAEFEVGLANLFIQHTSASLTVNENASPDVPLDLNDALDKLAPEGTHYRHLDEGLDDMPAHVKSSLMGPSLTLPIVKGRLALGMWQGIYLNEHRNFGGQRQIVVTIQGVKRADGRKYGAFS